MTGNGTYVSRHDQRVRIVTDVLMQRTQLADKAATDLAVQVLYALDRIPEKIR